jgi:hypothetical protein
MAVQMRMQVIGRPAIVPVSRMMVVVIVGVMVVGVMVVIVVVVRMVVHHRPSW